MHDSPLLLDIWKQVSRISADLKSLKSQLQDLMMWGRRCSLLVAIWVMGLIGNLSNDQLANLAATVLKRLIGS